VWSASRWRGEQRHCTLVRALLHDTFATSEHLFLPGDLMAAKKGTRKYGKKASKTVKSAMKRRKKGTLKRGKGGKGGTVKSRKQAIAIGLSEARAKGAKVPAKKTGRKKSAKKSARKKTAKKSTRKTTAKKSARKRSAKKSTRKRATKRS
jgi:hypothetical protein